jgi:hypothetical protein
VLGGCDRGRTLVRIHPGALLSVKAEPGSQELSRLTVNTVVDDGGIGFAVTVENTSGARERHVEVTLTIPQSPSSLVETQTIDRLDGGQTKTLLFRSFGQVQFATKTAVKIEVRPKGGQPTTTAYPVVFALGSPRSSTLGSGARSGLHGTGLVSVTALNGKRRQRLSRHTENTIVATTRLAFAVTIADTGDSQEVQVKVALTIGQTPSPVVRTKTIALINPGQERTIVFGDLGAVTFATRLTLKVDVRPVPEEKSLANNSAVYPVIFSL